MSISNEVLASEDSLPMLEIIRINLFVSSFDHVVRKPRAICEQELASVHALYADIISEMKENEGALRSQLNSMAIGEMMYSFMS
jgi:hypothetical protein